MWKGRNAPPKRSRTASTNTSFLFFAYDKKTGKVLRLLHATLNNNPTLDGILGRLSIGGLRGEVHLLKSCQCDFTYHLAAGDLIERSLQRFSPELAALLCQNGANCTCVNGLRQALQINALLRLVGRFEHCAGEHEFPMEARAFVLETVHIHGLAKHTMGLGPEP